MTEQQIENLKKTLSSSERMVNSRELDEKILKAAILKAPERERFSDFVNVNHQPLNFISLAALSILFTVGVFSSLGYILSNDKLVSEKNIATNTNIIEQQHDGLVQERPVQIKNQTDVIEKPFAESARQQILTSMETSDIETLLNGMSFSHLDDRLLAKTAITEAISDIRFMVMDGQLNSARERYERLRRSCSVCTLPDTLEALVRIDGSSFNRS